MDDLGLTFLVIAIVFFVAAIIAFWVLSKKGPHGAVLAVGAVMFMAAHSVPPDIDSRELRLVKGVLAITGCTGCVLGAIDFLRKRPRPQKPECVNVELVDEGGEQLPCALEPCPTCNTMVARQSDGSCPVCHAKKPA